MASCILRSEKPLANGCLLRRHDWIYPNLITDHGFPGGSDSKASACNVGDPGLIAGLGRFPWRRKWQPTPDSCLENQENLHIEAIGPNGSREYCSLS